MGDDEPHGSQRGESLTPGVVCFGPFAFDTTTSNLSCGPDEIPLPPRVGAVLLALLERAGEIVPKEDILGSAWAGAFVGEDSLTQAVSQLRSALGDDPQHPTYIQTIPKRGYRFKAKVTVAKPGDRRTDPVHHRSTLASARSLQFGPFAFDIAACRLSRDGVEIHLTPKTAAVLCHLLQHRDELISKDQFLESVWEGVHVREESLTQAISAIRQALGDSALSPRFIQTVQGEGYRFIGDATSEKPRNRPVVTAEPAGGDEPIPILPSPPSPHWWQTWVRPVTMTAAVIVTFGLLALVWIDGPSDPPRIRRPLTSDGGRKENPALSPDGNSVAFDWEGPEGGDRDIWVLQIGPGTVAQPITKGPCVDRAPVWSPDGQEIAFVRICDGKPAIYRIPSRGGRATKIVDAEMPFFPQNRVRVSWSSASGGRYLAFSQASGGPSMMEDTNSRIFLVDLNQQEPQPIPFTTPPGGAAMGDRLPSFSPDGRQVAFVRSSSTYGGKDIWVQGIDDTQAQKITSEAWEYCESLTWTPDSEEIVFTAGAFQHRTIYRVALDGSSPEPIKGIGDNDRWATVAGSRLVFSHVTVGARNIWEAPGRLAENRNASARSLIRTDFFDGNFSYSADGQRITLQSGRTGRMQIWIADAEGRDQTLLFPWEYDAYVPRWSPDRSHIAFDSSASGNLDVYVADVASGHFDQLTSIGANDGGPTFSRDGKTIYFQSDRSGENQIYRMPADGGESAESAVKLTREGGSGQAFESEDGYLYYSKTDANTGIWRVPVDGGPEEGFFAGPILYWADWDLVDSGIYYGIRSDGGFTVYYRAFDSQESEEVFRGEGWFVWLRVSPDERSIAYSMNDEGASAELVLVENFR